MKVALNTINHQILECFHVVFPSGYAIFRFHIRKVSQRGEKIQWQNKDKRQSLLQPPKLYVHNGNESFHSYLDFFSFLYYLLELNQTWLCVAERLCPAFCFFVDSCCPSLSFSLLRFWLLCLTLFWVLCQLLHVSFECLLVIAPSVFSNVGIS